MAEMTNLNIRIDKDIKESAEALFNEMGMSITTAFNIFVRQTLMQRKIPFEIKADPFYSESNMKVLRQSIKEAEEGKVVEKTSVISPALKKRSFLFRSGVGRAHKKLTYKYLFLSCKKICRYKFLIYGNT